MRYPLPLPENVRNAAFEACFPGLPEGMALEEARRRVDAALQPAFAEWGAKVDGHDGHNDHYRLVTEWTSKGQRLS